MRTFQRLSHLLWLLPLLAAWSCSDDESAPRAYVTVEPDAIELTAAGTAQTVTVNTNQAEWATESSADWVVITRYNEFLSISAAPNNTTTPRPAATVTVRAGVAGNNASAQFTVTQNSVNLSQSLLLGYWQKGERLYSLEANGALMQLVPSNTPGLFIIDPESIGNYVLDTENNALQVTIADSPSESVPIVSITNTRLVLGGSGDAAGTYTKYTDPVTVAPQISDESFLGAWRISDTEYAEFNNDGTGNFLLAAEVAGRFILQGTFTYSYDALSFTMTITPTGDDPEERYTISNFTPEGFTLQSVTDQNFIREVTKYEGTVILEPPYLGFWNYTEEGIYMQFKENGMILLLEQSPNPNQLYIRRIVYSRYSPSGRTIEILSGEGGDVQYTYTLTSHSASEMVWTGTDLDDIMTYEKLEQEYELIPYPLTDDYGTDWANLLRYCEAFDGGVLLNVNSLSGVSEGTPVSPVLTIDSPKTIVAIYTYHWNWITTGGGENVGVSLTNIFNEQTYAQCNQTPYPGQGGRTNANWIGVPNVTIPAGSYRVISTNPASWSYAGDTQGQGITVILGY